MESYESILISGSLYNGGRIIKYAERWPINNGEAGRQTNERLNINHPVDKPDPVWTVKSTHRIQFARPSNLFRHLFTCFKSEHTLKQENNKLSRNDSASTYHFLI